MNVVLFDKDPDVFYPLSFTRPISFIRIGILTIFQKWEKYYSSVSVYTQNYLSKKFLLNLENDNLWIDSRIIPSLDLITELNNLRIGEGLSINGEIFAFRNKKFDFTRINIIESNVCVNSIKKLSDIFEKNLKEIINDFDLIKTSDFSNLNLNDKKRNISVIGNHPIFIDKSAKLQHCVLNSTNGPIYIGKNTEIMEGSFIRGPFAILDNSVVKIGAKIYEGTTIGPNCKVAGEVNNVVFFGFSNKSHEGFLGNSVIGEWCNLGADTNNSNLKNTYDNVKLWDYSKQKFCSTDLQFCGLIMGDHSKCGINTMFNTGTVVGVGANIYGSGFMRNFIPSFSWGGSSGFKEYKLTSFLETCARVFERRSMIMNSIDVNILENIFEMTKKYRRF